MPTRTTATLRRATVEDAPRITQHRHLMYTDMAVTTEDRLHALDAAFEPWVRSALADGSYTGLLIESSGEVIAGAGIYSMPFPPHWMHDEPRRAFLLNFYVAPEFRGQGFANQLLRAALAICRDQDFKVVTLHASQFGRPIYAKHGFQDSPEMLLRLQDH